MSLEITRVPSFPRRTDRPTIDGDRKVVRSKIEVKAAGCSVDFETPKGSLGKERISVQGPSFKIGGSEKKPAEQVVAQPEKAEAVSAGSSVPADMVVDFRGGHNGIRATLLDGGLIRVEEQVDTNWTCINKTSYSVPKGAKYLVVEVLGGKFPKIGAEDKHGMNLMLGEKSGHPYPDYVVGSKGKHYFKIPKKLAGGTAEQLQLIFAPGKISAGAQMKVYFAKSK